MATEVSVVGPWGGEGGQPWSYMPQGANVLSRIFITYGDIIDSILFESRDGIGNSDISQFGTSVGSKNIEINIDATEKLSGISGTFGAYHNLQLVTSLSFTTDRNKSYGPFGTPMGDAFSYEVKCDEIISGFHGRAGSFIDAIGVYLKPKSIISVGPWGGEGGQPWSYVPQGANVLSRIFITYGDIIDSILFESRDGVGNSDVSQFGTSVGSKNSEINIDATEKLIGISGTFGAYHNLQLVTSLSFTTDRNKSYGPFGTPMGDAFSYEVKCDKIISGFHGRAGSFIDAIGVYLEPKTNLIVGPWGGEGGQPWSYVPECANVLTRIFITYGDIIDSILFESRDGIGNTDVSQFGTSVGSKNTEINIDATEKLIGISGTFGAYHNLQLVTSLSFTTDRNKSYGPFGTPMGDAFSYEVKYGEIISGFHGRAGSFIDAIGVVVVTPN